MSNYICLLVLVIPCGVTIVIVCIQDTIGFLAGKVPYHLRYIQHGSVGPLFGQSGGSDSYMSELLACMYFWW